jgi:hypothetical protein
MADVAATAPMITAAAAAAHRRPPRDGAKIALAIMVAAVLAFLYLPVVVLIVFSFNDN